MRIDDLKLLKKICKMNELNLHHFLYGVLRGYGYEDVKNTNMYIIAEGNIPICLCAHMDTVFKAPPTEIFYDNQNKVMWSPQGLGADDRAGIFIILKILERGYRPSIIFTHGEETGGKGADAIVQKYGNCPFKQCKALIQLDRQGWDDAVYYECENNDFEQKISSYGFKTEWGTFSDISILAPIWGIAAVNLSVGYIREHSTSETLYTNVLIRTMYKVCDMFDDIDTWLDYIYIKKIYNSHISAPWFGWGFPTEEDEEEVVDSEERCLCCNRVIDKEESHYKYDIWKICPECYTAYFA